MSADGTAGLMFVNPLFTCLKFIKCLLQQQKLVPHPLSNANTMPKPGKNGLIPIENHPQGSVIISKGM